MRFCSYCKQVLVFIFITSTALLSAKPFVIGRLWTGQLGNQFFEIAAAVSLALDHDADVFFPDFAVKTIDGIPTNYKHVFFRLNATVPKEKIQAYYIEPTYSYTPIPYHQNMCIQGYFQSEKHFAKHKQKILELFAPSSEIREYLESKYQQLLKSQKTVSIHVRSYWKDDPQQKIYPNYGKDYFEKAIMKFPEDSVFLAFSNDMARCKQILADIPRKIIFIEGEPYYHDFYLMAMCKHNIISNSSFSWWAAYLNPNPEKIVIAPPEWYTSTCGLNYKDVVPESWTTLRFEEPISFLESADHSQHVSDFLEDPVKVFALANYYQKCSEHALALKYYEMRMKLKGRDEELFKTMMHIALMQERLNMPFSSVEASYETAFFLQNTRAEPLYCLGILYRNRGDFSNAYRVLKVALKIPYSDVGIVDKELYDWGILFVFSICAHYMSQFKECLKAYDELLANPRFPNEYRRAIFGNRQFALSQLNDVRFFSQSLRDASSS